MAGDLVAVMTEILDAQHPLPSKINKTTYTENLTTSEAALVALICANSPWSPIYQHLSAWRIGPAELHLDLTLAQWAAEPGREGRSRCSNRSASPEAPSRPSGPGRGRTGTVRANATPATVACTPDSCTNTQVARANGSSTRHPARTRRFTSRANAPRGTSAKASGSNFRGSGPVAAFSPPEYRWPVASAPWCRIP